MIEVIDNTIQVLVLFICIVISFLRAVHTNRREWVLMTMFYGVFFLGDLFWMLYVFFYHMNPQFYIPEISWDAAYLFLGTLLLLFTTEEERCRRYFLPVILVLAAAGFAIFYMQWGDYLSNVATAIVTSIVMYRSARGLLYLREEGISIASSGKGQLYLSTLTICVIEYCLWTISCFWMGDTLRNPYFWFDFMLTAMMLVILYTVRKAVEQ